ncbi:hypothetical protein ACIF70_25815 [Actinacidiphila glaucinigra]|uniref:hypothetical protein n=1 Tax=Actinacidiphila glaucinigra TaxID=235986 RepID=UPI002DD99F91|nr:hypothetical protein [Actinacidiphila glaucinigra]WSD63944.1 hypothetical protein OIE69_36170 [Actinacidiphila glaucinigra]
MIMLSIDTTSESYAAGQSVAALLFTAGAMAAIWFATRTWRRGPVPGGAVDAERAGAQAVRRGNIVRGVLLVVAAAGLVRASTYEGEPPAAYAAPVVRERVIDAAPRVGAYRLLTGAEVAEFGGPATGRATSAKRWFYDGPGEGPVGALLQINAVEWDTGLAEEKRSDTMGQELRNAFAGARATEVTAFEAGPWGGRLSCGFMTSIAGRPTVCAWTDGGTSGLVMLLDEKSLSEAAELALRFRTASEKRT